MDYLESLDRKGAHIVLGGEDYTCRPVSLRDHFRLQALATLLDEEAVPRYVAIAMGVALEKVLSWDGVEVLEAYERLIDLNSPSPLHIDFARIPGERERYGYPGRGLALIVLSIARATGWPRDFILNEMTYDEARCYLQDILLREHSEHEFLYSLSETSYDKNGRYRRLPPPSFPPQLPTERAAEQNAQQRVAPRRTRVPGVVGNIVDFEEEARKRGQSEEAPANA